MTRTEAIAKIEATRAEFADTVTKARNAARRITAEANAETTPWIAAELHAKARRMRNVARTAISTWQERRYYLTRGLADFTA
jgi:hypothetical protein